MEYQVQVVRDEAGLRELAGPWTRLLAASPAASIFVSFPWCLAWWHHFGAAKGLYVLVATDRAGQVCGIAPLMLQHVGSARKLAFIGTSLGDSGDFVLHPECAEAAALALCAYLFRRHREWDLADLDEIPPYSSLLSALQDTRPAGWHVIRIPRTDSPFIPLPASWEAYTSALQRKPRYHLESYTRRFVAETGATFRLISAEDDVPAAVARFYRLHLARWAVKPEALNPEHLAPTFLPFLEEVCLRCAAAGYLRLAELAVGGAVIASWISFAVNGRWNGYMTGFDPAWSHKRPGKILHGFVVRQALAEQARELDFGRGAEEYKYELGATNRQNWRLLLASRAPRSTLAFALTALRIQGRDLVHRSGNPKRPRPA